MKIRPVAVLLAIPIPPPFSGPEINSQFLLSSGLGPEFRIFHLRTNVNLRNRDKGRLSVANLSSALMLWLQLMVVMIRHRPRVVYLYLSQNKTGFLRDAIIIITARVFSAQVVAHVHGGNFGNFYKHATPEFQRLIRFIVGRLNRVILQAHRLRIQFKSIFPDEHIRILANAIDVRPFDDFRLNEMKVDGVLTILFVGHLGQAKGFIDLLKAAPQVLEAVPKAVFVFAGEWLVNERNILFDETGHRLHFGSESAYSLWSNLRRRYGERLKHLGILNGSRKIKAYLRADVFVLPSYSEGFPMVVLEAMAASLPVVVTPVGALPEVLQEGINAQFVMPGDIDALVGALVELACREEKRKQMGIANRKLVETVFTPYKMSNDLADILKECLS